MIGTFIPVPKNALRNTEERKEEETWDVQRYDGKTSFNNFIFRSMYEVISGLFKDAVSASNNTASKNIYRNHGRHICPPSQSETSHPRPNTSLISRMSLVQLLFWYHTSCIRLHLSYLLISVHCTNHR